MTVTVLMPVYNAEKYLETSINSLLVQTSSNWRLICVDDGSTDKSLDILKDYELKDKRICVLTQKNAGPAVARAKAIELADTDYVSILDADDAYSKNYVELMLKRAEETNADIVVPDVWTGNGDVAIRHNLLSKGKLHVDMVIEDGREALALTIPWRLHGWPMIRTLLAKQYYTTEIASYSKFNSDEYITRLLYLKSKKIVFCKACYKHIIVPDSITHTPSLKLLDYLITLDKLVDLCEREDAFIETKINLYILYFNTLFYISDVIRKLPELEQKEAKHRVSYFYRQSYCKKMSFKIWIASSMKLKVKFTLSLIHFSFINGQYKKWIKNLKLNRICQKYR